MLLTSRGKSIEVVASSILKSMPNALCFVLFVLQEVRSIKDSYKKKAKMTTEVLNSMENVKCNEVAGAMYAFPRITLPKKAIEAAKVSCLVSGPDF